MTARLAFVAVVLVVLSAWTHARPRAVAGEALDFASTVPLAFDEWIGRDAPPLAPDVAAVLAADQYVHRYYGLRGRAAQKSEGARVADVEFDLAYYRQPQAGAAMHSPLNCLPGNGWQVVASRHVRVGTTAARQLIVSRGATRIAMIYWFQNRGALVGNEYRQRLQLLTNGLQGRPTDAALVRVMALDTPEGHAAMNNFAPRLATRLAATFR